VQQGVVAWIEILEPGVSRGVVLVGGGDGVADLVGVAVPLAGARDLVAVTVAAGVAGRLGAG
jgi:hypothetical protein